MVANAMMMEFVRKSSNVQFATFITIQELHSGEFVKMTGLMYFIQFYLMIQPTCRTTKVIQVQ